jgi:hypothetical protein
MAVMEVCPVEGVPVHKAFVCADHIFEPAILPEARKTHT